MEDCEPNYRWLGDYTKLEYRHGFIQWLYVRPCALMAKGLLNQLCVCRFPIREFGMNFQSQPLQIHERETMKADKEIVERFIESYRLMLDFYGMELKSTETGLLTRAEPERKYIDRYRNLVRELSHAVLLHMQSN